MKLSKQTDLFNKYPELFQRKDLKPQETGMCYGIACGDGWYDLIDVMCSRLLEYDIQFNQIKEKFGGLRVYTIGNSLQAQGVVDMTEAMSFKICEKCGDSGRARNSGWIATMCDQCYNKTQNCDGLDDE